MAAPQENSLCRLRQDLELHPGPYGPDDMPTWTIHDPVSGTFYRIGWSAFEIVSRWHLGHAGTIAAQVMKETTLAAAREDVERIDQFLRRNFLCAPAPGDLHRYEQVEQAQRPSLKRLAQTYLFLKIPLVRPESFLRAVLPFFRWAFTRQFVWAAVTLSLVSLVLLSRHWNEFLATFTYFFRIEGLVVYGLTIFFSKALHEFAHAITAKHYGLRVPTLGVAILVFWPLLYTDASESWKLTDKHKRMAIAGAGILSEIFLAAMALILWVFLEDGPLRSSCFLLASTNWITTIIFNMNPFMRFDGYFILSDLLNFENLQQRAFGFTRWRIYEHLFPFNPPAPETVPLHLRRPLLFYALATWIYRVVIIVSISLLIYHLFFKLLGLILLIGQITKVVFLPLVRGIQNLYLRRADMRLSLPASCSFLLFLLLGISLFVPWGDTLKLQAVLLPSHTTKLHAPESGVLERVVVTRNRAVHEQEVLFRLSAPRIDHELRLTSIRVHKIQRELESMGFSNEKQQQRLVYLAEVEQLRARRQGLLAEQEALTIKSPMAGIVALPRDRFGSGDWVEKNSLLATVSNLQQFQIIAYVSEFDLYRLQRGAQALFFSPVAGSKPLAAAVVSIDEHSLTELENPSFASLYKGSLPVKSTDGQAMTVMGTYYKVVLTPTEVVEPVPLFALDGTVRIEVAPESMAVKARNKIAGVLIRESVF